jgi:hypothetical protein
MKFSLSNIVYGLVRERKRESEQNENEGENSITLLFRCMFGIVKMRAGYVDEYGRGKQRDCKG